MLLKSLHDVPSPRAAGRGNRRGELPCREPGTSSPHPSPPQVCGGEGENKVSQKARCAQFKGVHLTFWQDDEKQTVFVPSPRASGERVRERGTTWNVASQRGTWQASSPRPSPPQACGGEGDMQLEQKVGCAQFKVQGSKLKVRSPGPKSNLPTLLLCAPAFPRFRVEILTIVTAGDNSKSNNTQEAQPAPLPPNPPSSRATRTPSENS